MFALLTVTRHEKGNIPLILIRSVYDVYVSMPLFPDLDIDSTATNCRLKSDVMSSNAMDARARGRGRGRRVGEGGAGLPAPGPPSLPRTLEERVSYVERRLDNLIDVVQMIAKDRDDDRRDAWKCLAEVRNLNADILAELRRRPAPNSPPPP